MATHARSAALLCGLLWAACRGDGPAVTGPTPAAAPPTPSPPAATFRLSGLVIDGNDRPIPGAALRFYSGPGVVTAASDSAGAYAVVLDRPTHGFDVWVEAGGHETASHFVAYRSSPEWVYDVRMHRIERMAAGNAVALSLKPDDPLCGFDLEYRCRKVRVTPESAGLMRLRVHADAPSTRAWLAVGDVDYRTRVSASAEFQVSAGVEVVVSLLLDWTTQTVERLTLASSLESD